MPNQELIWSDSGPTEKLRRKRLFVTMIQGHAAGKRRIHVRDGRSGRWIADSPFEVTRPAAHPWMRWAERVSTQKRVKTRPPDPKAPVVGDLRFPVRQIVLPNWPDAYASSPLFVESVGGVDYVPARWQRACLPMPKSRDCLLPRLFPRKPDPGLKLALTGQSLTITSNEKIYVLARRPLPRAVVGQRQTVRTPPSPAGPAGRGHRVRLRQQARGGFRAEEAPARHAIPTRGAGGEEGRPDRRSVPALRKRLDRVVAGPLVGLGR